MKPQPLRSQVSHDNPGWYGKGIPTLKALTVSSLPQLLHLIRKGKFGHARHFSAAVLANLWNFYGPPARTNRVICPCCGWTGPAFIASSGWRTVTFQSKCPQCDSRSRHRALTRLIPDVFKDKPAGKILFFAPERVLLQQLEHLVDPNEIVTTDYNSQDVDFPNEDIQRLTLANSSFGMIVCNHVLEHVPDDESALAECARVLCPEGLALFTIPGDFGISKTRTFDKPDDNGHFRHYGLDVLDEMRLYFHRVEAIDMHQQAEPEWMVRPGDYAFVCVK